LGGFESAAERLLEGFRLQRPMRAGSLIISFFGDVVGPRGGSIWLGSIIEALEPLGVSSRLVRTSVYRLVQDGWFLVHRQGRKSFYRLTPTGQRRFRQATTRIYNQPEFDWEGEWLLALLPQAAAEARENIRRDLSWMGFGSLAPGVMARPVPPGGKVEGLVSELDPLPVTFLASLAGGAPGNQVLQLVRECWKLEQIETGYQQFLRRFETLVPALNSRPRLPGDTSLALRVLLIHEYRRILLSDPQLPAALLPKHWHGRAAYELCKALYNALQAPSEQFVSSALYCDQGALPEPDPFFFRRFGGLRPA